MLLRASQQGWRLPAAFATARALEKWSLGKATAARCFGGRPTVAKAVANLQNSSLGQETDLLLERLQSVGTCALCNASKSQARVVGGVRPLQRGYSMVGRARTVRVDADHLEVLVAIRDAMPGEVIMIDTYLRGGSHDVLWPQAGGMLGELMAKEAKRRGVTGIVLDGNYRDSKGLADVSLPIFARGSRPDATHARLRGQSQGKVQLGGAIVHPGEYVLGDNAGVVVLSEEELHKWLPEAESIQKAEMAIHQHMQDGGSLFDRLPEFDENMAAAAKDESKSCLGVSRMILGATFPQ